VRVARIIALAGSLAIAGLGLTATSVGAYGRADQPLAQIAFSASCNNPSFPLCDPTTGFGLGGIWIWVEIDANQTGDVAGADCTHVRGVGGGAGSIRGDVTWWWSATPEGIPAIPGPLDPNGYYNVALPVGQTLSFNVSVGHYSAHPVPGVTLNLQVAP
jgi:hypothetical protein